MAVNLKTHGLMPLVVFLMLTFFLGTAAARPHSFSQTSRVVAGFSYNSTNSPVVQFTDTSTGNINSYKWDFGDGTSSTAENPNHTYTAGGTYQVTLTVAQNRWWFDTTTKDVSVSAPTTTTVSTPVANFTANPGSGKAPLKVQFNDMSSGTPTSWRWAFGDGASSTAEDPSYTFNGAGTYGVTLTASNSAGSSTKTTSITVSPVPPVANFTANPSSGTAPLSVKFTDSSTGTISSWAWNFGDGSTSSAQNPSHTFSSANTYTATLTVTNSSGSSSKAAIITVNSTTASSPTRNLFLQPFSSTSPWNYPIGTGAVYANVPNLSSIAGLGLRYGDNWTTGIYFAKTTDRQGTLYFRNDMWDLLNGGITINGVHYPVHNSGNPPEVENALLNGPGYYGIVGVNDLPYRSGSSGPIWNCNFYSTCVPANVFSPTWPAGMHKTTDNYWSPIFYSPQGAVPSPDTDGNITIYQPNGWFLDCINAVMLSNGSIVCSMASYIDSAGSGDGYTNGRRASEVPSFAGQIRQGEITSGKIQHALVCNISATILTQQAIWPAVCFDTQDGYTGTLPMGALLAIPQSVDINSLGLTPKGLILARALQDYGMYVMDRGGSGCTILAELTATDVRWTNQQDDLNIILKNLKWVSNNSQSNPGGGGTPLVPLLP
jgi:PKD repeat protein